MFLKKTAEKKI